MNLYGISVGISDYVFDPADFPLVLIESIDVVIVFELFVEVVGLEFG